MKRFICHFLIVWLALLSSGTYAHAAADAAQELGHIAAHAQLIGAEGAEKAGVTHDHGPAETCSQSHCSHGHATGMLAAAEPRFSEAGVGAPLPTLQAWASHQQPGSIDRPKWKFTTPAVVNL